MDAKEVNDFETMALRIWHEIGPPNSEDHDRLCKFANRLRAELERGQEPVAWAIGRTLHTKQTAKWTPEQWAKNDAEENRCVFAHFSAKDELICVCETREQAERVVADHNASLPPSPASQVVPKELTDIIVARYQLEGWRDRLSDIQEEAALAATYKTVADMIPTLLGCKEVAAQAKNAIQYVLDITELAAASKGGGR